MISSLTGSSTIRIKRIWSLQPPYATGFDIICKDVFNIAYGQVVYVGQYDGLYTVNIKSNNNEVLRYGHLRYVSVNTGSYIKEGQRVGFSDEYLHLEYATTWKGSSLFPVRINDLTYYKQDPQDILDGGYTIEPEVALDYAPTSTLTQVTYTEDQKSEFTGGKW